MDRFVTGLFRILGVAALACIAASCELEPYSEAGLKVDSPNARIRVVAEDGAPVMLIENSQGIGSCVVTLTSGSWPGVLKARFAYSEERTFRDMETITVSNDDRVMTTRLGARKPVEVMAVTQGTAESAKVYTSAFTVAESAEGVEVAFPMALLKDRGSFQVEWVDLLRRRVRQEAP